MPPTHDSMHGPATITRIPQRIRHSAHRPQESGPARSPAQKTRCSHHSGIRDDRGPSSTSARRSESTSPLRDRCRDQPHVRRSGAGGGTRCCYSPGMGSGIPAGLRENLACPPLPRSISVCPLILRRGPCAFSRWRCSDGPRSRPSACAPRCCRRCWSNTSGSSWVSPKSPK